MTEIIGKKIASNNDKKGGKKHNNTQIITKKISVETKKIKDNKN